MTGLTMMRRGLFGLAGAMMLNAAPAFADVATAPLMVIAEIVAKPEGTDTIRATMTTVAAGALKEKGCLSYKLYEDRDHPGCFLTYESWTDDAALTAHLTAPAMQQGIAKLAPLLVQPPVITKLKGL